MPVVFEDLEPGEPVHEPRPRRAPRWLATAAGVVAIGVVVAVVGRGDDGRPVATPSSPPSAVRASPQASTVFSPVAAVELVPYELRGVMTLYGAPGWREDTAADTPESAHFVTVDPATGGAGPRVAFGIADDAPHGTIEDLAARYGAALTAAGARMGDTVFSAIDGGFAADLVYNTADGQYVLERIWVRDGRLLTVRIAAVPAQVAVVDQIFDDSVKYGQIS